MKFLSWLLAAGFGLLLLSGCSGGADENKTPEQIRAEVQTLDRAAIEKQIQTYLSAIDAKKAEMDKELAKLKAIPLSEILGDKAQQIKADLSQLTVSLEKLSANLQAYREGLTTK